MPLRLLRQLNTDLGPDFLLTMAPVASALLGSGGNGLHGFNQKEMDDQATDPARPNGKLVSWYNAQFYNGWVTRAAALCTIGLSPKGAGTLRGLSWAF